MPRKATTDIEKLFCSVIGCENIVKARGLCSTHHQQWYRSGKTILEREQRFKDTKHIKDLLTGWVRCKTPGCENRGHPTLEHCPECYDRIHRYQYGRS